MEVPVVTGGFVGRARELGALLAGFGEAIAARGGLYLLAGEAGIGKTRLADEVSARAAARSATVLWGRCWEGGGAPPYWPWVQILRGLERVSGSDGAAVSPVSISMPGLAASLPAAVAATTDSGHARFELFDAVTRFLRGASEKEPLVLVLDDLHAADLPSLLLLRFAAGELRQSRLLVIGTYRDAELRMRTEAAAAIDALAGEHARVVLAGLSPTETGALIEETAGTTPSPKLAEAVHRTTEGNPLFVDEIVRLLMAERPATLGDASADAELRVPERLRDTIRRRLAPLSAECTRLLSLASVVGREFDLPTLERVPGVERRRVSVLLAEALAAGVLRREPGGRCAFSHGLVRETLYDDLDLSARMRLHREIGEALERLDGDGAESHVAELAHHFMAAAPIGDVDRAIGYAMRAGDRAREQLAWEEASAHYRRALRVLDLKPAAYEPRRCELLLSLGEAESAAGNKAEATECFQRAAVLARRLGLAESLARAALGLGGVWIVRTGTRDEALLDLLEEALSALGERDGALRASLLARLAIELRWSERTERRDALSAEAVTIARRLGDERTLAFALMARHWAIPGPDDLGERLAAADEIVSIAERVGDRPMALVGRTWRMAAHLELGRLAEACTDIDAVRSLAEAMRSPHYRWWATGQQVTLALLEGRFGEAESLATEAFVLGQQAQVPDAPQAFGLQIAAIRREQGRLPEIEGALRAFVDDVPLVPGWRSVLAGFFRELGRESEARRELEVLIRGELRGLPRDNFWLSSITLLAEVAAALGHVDAARLLYRHLLPYAARSAVAGPGVLWAGPVARSLGLLAATLSRFDEAVEHLETALEKSRAVGARPHAVRTEVDLAETLRARGAPGDAVRAGSMLESAAVEAATLGMTSLLGKIRSHAAADEGDPPRRRPTYVLRREDGFWKAGREGGNLVRLKERKGFRFLAHLLAHPGAEFGALELSALAEGAPIGPPAARGRALVEAGLRVSDLGDAGEMLDRRARAEYRRCLSNLRDELDEARTSGDRERAGRLGVEIETLARELARGVGLGGRDRRAASSAERARMAVTKAVRTAIERIAREEPAFGRHLRSTIRTGATFSYRGEDPAKAR